MGLGSVAYTAHMATASFYHILRAFPAIHALVVKGVCDYAHMQKDDAYLSVSALRKRKS